jgi:shikimate dehydrogenase
LDRPRYTAFKRIPSFPEHDEIAERAGFKTPPQSPPDPGLTTADPCYTINMNGKGARAAIRPPAAKCRTHMNIRRSPMKKSYRSELVGVFGDPIDDNPTIAVEEAAFKAKGLDYRYITFLVRPEDLGVAVESLRALNMRGINITAPHKVEVVQYLDDLSQAAEIIGAVNTIVRDGDRLRGENTDGKGFLKSVADAGIAVAGKRVVIFGAGGAARAIAVELALAGAGHISVINRSAERGRSLAEVINAKTACKADYAAWNDAYRVPADTDILINGTTLGMYPNDGAKPNIDYGTLRADMAVCDVVAMPPDTLFLREAKRAGATTIDGLGMLVNQGAINFTLWTGEEAPVDVMTRALLAEYGR